MPSVASDVRSAHRPERKTPAASWDLRRGVELRPAADRKLAWLIGTLATLGATAVSAWVAFNAIMPKGPDVIGPWAVAFAAVGQEPAIDMGGLPPYSVGMGLLLAPLVPLIEDPTLRYQVAVVLLGVLSTLGAAASALIARHTLRAGATAAAAAFALASLTTAVSFESTLTWAEPLAIAWLPLCLLLGTIALAHPSNRATMMAAAFSGTATLVHGRFVLVPVVMATMLVGNALADLIRGRDNRADVYAKTALTLTSVLASFLVCNWIRRRGVEAAWSEPSFRSDTNFLSRIDEISYWWAVVRTSVGHTWYLLASTFGLAGVGVWLLTRAALGYDARLGRRTAVLILLGCGATFATSVLWIAPALLATPPSRLDYLVYGRYIGPAVVLLGALGAAGLVARATTARAAIVASMVALVGTGAITVLVRRSLTEPAFPVNETVISGVASWPIGRPGLDILAWTMFALLGAAGLLGAATIGTRTLVFAVGCLLVVGAISGGHRAIEEHRAWDNSILYASYPDAGEESRAVVPRRARTSGLGYEFNYPSQQYALADEGWEFESTDVSVEALANDPPDDAGIVVLLWSTMKPTGSWCQLPPYEYVVPWARTDLFVGATDGTPCPASEP